MVGDADAPCGWGTEPKWVSRFTAGKSIQLEKYSLMTSITSSLVMRSAK